MSSTGNEWRLSSNDESSPVEKSAQIRIDPSAFRIPTIGAVHFEYVTGCNTPICPKYTSPSWKICIVAKSASHFIAPDSCSASPEALGTFKITASGLALPGVFQSSLETMVILDPVPTYNSEIPY
ncbi:hypothetical protein ACTXT7_015717 [Hymenolepis weldensis]